MTKVEELITCPLCKEKGELFTTAQAEFGVGHFCEKQERWVSKIIFKVDTGKILASLEAILSLHEPEKTVTDQLDMLHELHPEVTEEE